MTESGRTTGSPGDIGTDPAAFAAFYRAHVEAVQRFVSRRVADPWLAADLTAEVFLAVVESAGGYRPERGSQVGWLYGIARHVVAGDRRRRAREADASRRLAGRRLVDADDLARLEERIDAEAHRRRLYEAYARLGEAERAVLELVSLDGLTVSEAATALGIAPVTARVRLHRARKHVRDRLPVALAASRPTTQEATS